MRIRKNARLITSPSSSFLVCQLNRSPWDVDSFSFQGESENGFDASSSFAQGFPSSNSVESMELSYEYVEKTMPPAQLEMEERECKEIGGDKDGNKDNNGWQQLKAPPPKKRGRPKKPTPATTTSTTTTAKSDNPYEFYYYSGFGPSWGRRRGGTNNTSTSGIAAEDDGSNCCNTMINHAQDSSSSSLVMSEDNTNNHVVVMDSVVEGELDYIEDDFDDDENNLGRRRVRKLVKARSLKSLM